MMELLNAIHANNTAVKTGDFDYPAMSKDLKIGAAVTNLMLDNEDARYLLSKVVGTAAAAGVNISVSSLYRARNYYLARANTRRRK